MSTPLGDIPSTTPMSNAAEVAAQIFSLNGSSLSVSLLAGANITLNSGLRSITIVGPTVPAATNFSLNGTSSSVSLVAGANITINSGASSMTIVGPTVPAATQFTLNGTTESVSLVAGANITLTSGASSITIVGPAATHFSLNGTSSSVSLVAGANITLNSGASSITIVGPTPAAAIDFSLNGSSSSVSLVAGANITFNSGVRSITIVGPTVPSITQFTLNGTTNSVSLVAGANITLNSGANSITIVGPTPAAAVDFSLNGSSSSVSLVAGANITLNSGASSITIVAAGAPAGNRLTYTQNFLLQEAVPISIGVLASTGTTAASATDNPFGSSMSLQRIFIPAAMSLTEVDLAFGISFPATNSGLGSMSQTMILYSFGNSTSLASVISKSRAVTWNSGTTTAGTASSLQQGWAGNNIQPFTFDATSLAAGEYAIAHLLSWAAASTSWTVTVFGANAGSSFSASAVTGITTASLPAARSFTTADSSITAFTDAPVSVNAALTVGTVTASAFTDSSSFGLTAFTDTPINLPVFSSGGLSAASGITGALGVARYGAAFIALSTAGSQTAFTMSAPASAAASSQNTVVSVSVTNTAKSASFQLKGESTNNSIVSNVTLGVQAGSIWTGSTTGNAISNARTAAASLLRTEGLLGGVFYTSLGAAAVLRDSVTDQAVLAAPFATASMTALSAAGTATASSGFATHGIPSFKYNGSFAMTTASTDASYLSGPFSAGILLTGSSLASVDLKRTDVTVTGSIALVQPWFALCGS